MTERRLDVVCLGRAAVDLYGQQIGGRLEDMQSFAKYLGGSSGNVAAGLARLGVRSGMLTRVGDEAMGRFVREELARQGVDVSGVRTDPTRLTGLVVLGIGSADDIPHIFFRERCADMGLVEEDVDEAYVASAGALAVTGTHLSTPSTRAAVECAVACARRHGTRVVLDIDYRPVLWGFVGAGDGASRFVPSAEVTAGLQALLPDCDLVVGTEEEIAIAGGATDPVAALQRIRAATAATIVLKRGAEGCVVFDSADIHSLEQGTHVPGCPVEVFNTLGAGDAFLAGFLSAWVEGAPLRTCGEVGNACGALVVARHGCTPAMPSRVELEAFMARQPPRLRPGEDEVLNHLHRVTTWQDDPRPLCVLAFDHRSQFEHLAGVYGREVADIAAFKHLITDALLDVAADGIDQVRHGAIVDHRHGAGVLTRLAGTGLWCASPVEVPGSRPLDFDPHFALGATVATWPVSQVVKCLVFYHPDDPAELRHEQEERLRGLYAELIARDRRLVLEVICPRHGAPVQEDTLARALRRLYNLGIRPDWWKLEAQTAGGWRAVSEVITACDPHCKGVVLLGQGVDEDTLAAGLEVAAGFPACRGFAVGRSIFAYAAQEWFAGRMNDDQARDAIAQRYRATIGVWCEAAGLQQTPAAG